MGAGLLVSIVLCIASRPPPQPLHRRSRPPAVPLPFASPQGRRRSTLPADPIRPTGSAHVVKSTSNRVSTEQGVGRRHTGSRRPPPRRPRPDWSARARDHRLSCELARIVWEEGEHGIVSSDHGAELMASRLPVARARGGARDLREGEDAGVGRRKEDPGRDRDKKRMNRFFNW
jgi:hypothetical protein